MKAEPIKKSPSDLSNEAFADLVAVVIHEIRKGRPVDDDSGITDRLIKSTCLKYGVEESHIRLVAGWDVNVKRKGRGCNERVLS